MFPLNLVVVSWPWKNECIDVGSHPTQKELKSWDKDHCCWIFLFFYYLPSQKTCFWDCLKILKLIFHNSRMSSRHVLCASVRQSSIILNLKHIWTPRSHFLFILYQIQTCARRDTSRILNLSMVVTQLSKNSVCYFYGKTELFVSNVLFDNERMFEFML